MDVFTSGLCRMLSVEGLRHTKCCHMFDDTTAYQVRTCNEVFSLLRFCICAHLHLVNADQISNNVAVLRRLTYQDSRFLRLVMKWDARLIQLILDDLVYPRWNAHGLFYLFALIII